MLATTTTAGGEPTGGDDERADLSEDDVFEVLSNRRRRYTIHALKRAEETEEEPLDVADISEYVTAWELDIDPTEVEYDDRRNVHSTLRRTHLPKLEETNVITVDDETDVVRPTPALRDLDIYIEVLRGREIPWNQYYLGLAGLAGVSLLAVETGVIGFGAMEPLGIAVFTVTAFTVSALVHYYYGERRRLGNEAKPPELRRRS